MASEVSWERRGQGAATVRPAGRKVAKLAFFQMASCRRLAGLLLRWLCSAGIGTGAGAKRPEMRAFWHSRRGASCLLATWMFLGPRRTTVCTKRPQTAIFSISYNQELRIFKINYFFVIVEIFDCVPVNNFFFIKKSKFWKNYIKTYHVRAMHFFPTAFPANPAAAAARVVTGRGIECVLHLIGGVANSPGFRQTYVATSRNAL